VTAATTFTPRIRNEWWGLLTYPNVAIQSIMACRLFRELKLGVIVDHLAGDIAISTSIMFASAASTSPHIDESHNSEIIAEDTDEMLDESGDVYKLSPDASTV
jgi:hypothetical protein